MDKIPRNLQKWLDKTPDGTLREVFQDPETKVWGMRERPFTYEKQNSGDWDLLDRIIK